MHRSVSDLNHKGANYEQAQTLTEQELDWYSTKSLESAQALIEAYEELLCVMGKIVDSLTKSSVKESL